MQHRIAAIHVHLVSAPVEGGFADATRKVESLGFVIVRVLTRDGHEGIGITYNEVGGEATAELIRRNIVPKLIGRDPLETEVIWQEMFHYLRGVGRKRLTYCALSAVDIALWDLKGKFLTCLFTSCLAATARRYQYMAAAAGRRSVTTNWSRKSREWSPGATPP